MSSKVLYDLLVLTVRPYVTSAFVGLAIILISIPVPAYVGKMILHAQQGKMDVVSTPFPYNLQSLTLFVFADRSTCSIGH